MPRPHLSLAVRPLARSVPPGAPVEPVIRHLADRWKAGPGGVDHPLVAGRVFYLLPPAFLDALAEEFGDGAFDPVVWAVERRVAGGNAAVSDCVGYVGGRPLIYTHLFARRRFQVSPEWRATWGWTAAKAAEVAALIATRGPRFWAPARGYCGWLLTNPEFLAEHDRLLGRWGADVSESWLPPLWAASLGAESKVPPAEMAADFAGFLARWRLAGLAAPYLPLPLAPQVPALGPVSAPPAAGVTIFLPDTFPVPSREELRDAVEDALRGGEGPAHLAEWHALVRADNRAKNSIDRYGRLFVLQHLVAVVHARHGPALRRKTQLLERALARYLLGNKSGAEDSIHKDLAFVRRRLGPGWYEPDEPPTSGARITSGAPRK